MPTPETRSLRDFATFDLFAGLPHDAMDCHLEGIVQHFAPGEHLWHEGDEATHFLFVLAGNLDVFRERDGSQVLIDRFTEGMTGGELPLLAGTPHPGSAQATSTVEVFAIGQEQFWHMMAACPAVRARILAHMADRNASLNTMSYQHEKLIALGTMAAGLAHEINNPAAAAVSTSGKINTVLHAFDRHASELLQQYIFQEVKPGEYPFAAIEAAVQPARKPQPLPDADNEEDLTAWLQSVGAATPDATALSFAAVGLTRSLLADLVRQLKPEAVPSFLQWFSKDVELKRLAYELGQAVTRLSKLVAAMKNFSRMDEKPSLQPTDLAGCIEDTLTLMQYKLRQARIVKQIEPVPLVPAIGGEMVQVLTNLIDNAAYVLPQPGGVLTIGLHPKPTDPRFVLLTIADNGPGIPAAAQPRIFEAFFTTKPSGKGTGLGLGIAHRIITLHHNGTLSFETSAEGTTFTICLPVGLKEMGA